MDHIFQSVVLITGLLLSSMSAVAAPSVQYMSDVEVTDYAVRLSNVIEIVEHKQLCFSNSVQCLRTEFARYGVSYDDKEPVKKRLVLMIGSVF